MNVLIDLRALQSGVISGVEVYVENITRALCENAPHLHFFLWTNSTKALPQNFPEFSYKNATRLHTQYSNLLLTLKSFFTYRPKLDLLLAQEYAKQHKTSEFIQFDLILVPDPRPTPTSSTCQKITIFHDLSPLHFPQSFSVKTRFWQYLARLKKEAKEACHILTPSRFTKEDLQAQWKIPEEKITVIGAGKSTLLRPIHDAIELTVLCKKYHLPEKFFLTLSTLEPRKNLPNLLEAFSRFQKKLQTDNIFLIVAGQKNPEIFADLKLPTSRFVLFPGFIEEADKAALLSAAFAFICPSRFEGFGLPVLEALACGVAVISSSAAALPEVYGDAALSFDPENIAEMAERIEQMYLCPDIRTELQEKALARAQMPQFSWQTVAQKVLCLIDNLQKKQ